MDIRLLKTNMTTTHHVSLKIAKQLAEAGIDTSKEHVNNTSSVDMTTTLIVIGVSASVPLTAENAYNTYKLMMCVIN